MGHLPPQEYYRTLPRHIAAAGAVFHDASERILLVKPSYRTTWQLPGGAMEEGEYPLQTAAREVMEEVGLELTSGRLLAVDWAPAQDDGRPAQASYAFDGGHLDGGEARQRIRLQPGELTGWTMAGPDEWDTLLAPHTERRIRACLEALAVGGTAYLHHGWPVTPAS